MNVESSYPDPICTMDEFRSVLAEIEQPLIIDELQEIASRLKIPASQWQTYLSFNPHQFFYRTIYTSRYLEINVIGWRSGQFSSIHDHRGTACCVLVLDGYLTNIDYQYCKSRKLKETSRFEVRPGGLLSRNDVEIHCCGNDQPQGVDLATLHLYSPPLRPLDERLHHG